MQKAVVETKIKLAMTMVENENLKSTVQKLQQEIIQLTKQLNSIEPRVIFFFINCCSNGFQYREGTEPIKLTLQFFVCVFLSGSQMRPHMMSCSKKSNT
jgi:hypothetical protein